MYECWLFESSAVETLDCIWPDAGSEKGCDHGTCHNGFCECDFGWYAPKHTCNMCAPGFAWSEAEWDCLPAAGTTQCSTGCTADLKGDGICQPACNNAACDYDGNDCVVAALPAAVARIQRIDELGQEDAEGSWCSKECHLKWIADGNCD